MFRFHKLFDTVTLFHKPGSPASVRVATLLKQVSANAVAGATGDQASDHTATSVDRPEFELNITESLPTRNQLATILEYVASPHISTIVKGASTQAEALRKFQENSDNFQRPVVVDWNNGRAVAGANESQILQILKLEPKS